MGEPRYELKFYIPYVEYESLRHALDAILEKDKHAGKDGTYAVRSLYFDTLENKAFYEKMDGAMLRRKIRMRVYGTENKEVRIEMKSKTGNEISKVGAWISREDAQEVIKGNYGVLLRHKNAGLNGIYVELRSEKYRPVAMIDYVRRAYVHPYNNIRITFDYCLSKCCGGFDMFGAKMRRKLMAPEKIIMEIKYNGSLPLWIKNIVGGVAHNRSAISKFCFGRMGEFE